MKYSSITENMLAGVPINTFELWCATHHCSLIKISWIYISVRGQKRTCRLSRWEEDEEEALLWTGVDVLLMDMEVLSSELRVRPVGPLW